MLGSSLAAALAAMAFHSPAMAQNALGSGNALGRDLTAPQKHQQRGGAGGALDANSQVGADRYNPNAPKQDFYSRNLIVTSDVAGGRGFRGNVGYLGQGEFAGKTGADSNRVWDAYAANTSPLAISGGLNPYTATQQWGAVMYSRSYGMAQARDILTNEQPLDARLAFDRFTADASKMARQGDLIDAANPRDTGSRTNWRVEGKLPNGGNSAGSGAAGPAQGGVPMDALLSRFGLNTYERQALREDMLSGRTNAALVSDDFDTRAITTAKSLADSMRVQPLLPAEYTAILDTMRQRAGMSGTAALSSTDNDPNAVRGVGTAPLGTGDLVPDLTKNPGLRNPNNPAGTGPGTAQPDTTQSGPGSSGRNVPPIVSPSAQAPGVAPAGGKSAADKELITDLDWLRYQLQRSGPDAARAGGVNDPRASMAQPTKPSESGKADGGTAGASADTGAPGQSSGAGGDGKSAAKKKQSLDDLALVLKHGRRMESLIPENPGFIHDMMDLGAQSMRRDDFFRAEDIYTSILKVYPGHPMALAGVVNAQIGAGLTLSSALTMRKMFVEHPELIGAHFGAEILPAPERLAASLEIARTRLRAASEPDAGPQLAADRFDYGLLIAYIGFQQDKTDLVREGLDAMRATRADDPLLRVLQRVWLPDGEAPSIEELTKPAKPAEPPKRNFEEPAAP